jgi:hypothetical protein
MEPNRRPGHCSDIWAVAPNLDLALAMVRNLHEGADVAFCPATLGTDADLEEIIDYTSEDGWPILASGLPEAVYVADVSHAVFGVGAMNVLYALHRGVVVSEDV